MRRRLAIAAAAMVAAASGGTAAPQETLRVTREPLVDAPISPLQYGQFIEYLCNLVPGMWAERLYDGGFEGLSAYQFEYLHERDWREQPWLPCGATDRIDLASDREIKVGGDVAKRIGARGDAPCTIGVKQAGVFVEQEKACWFSCWMRQQGLAAQDGRAATVSVRLFHDEAQYAKAELAPTGEWQKLRVRLVPNATDAEATLAIEFRGPATLWLDNASLMPEENVGGWRPDVVRALRALKPGVIRFGGSALEVPGMGDFEWRDVIGDPDHRRPLRAWGGLQPVGAGLEEIMQLAQEVGAEPLICVRVTQRAPQDAADEIEYFNGAPDTPMGRRRAQNGHAEPYRIKYWQIGNEQGGGDYEQRLLEFAQAMKRADPTIRLLASYPSAGVLDRAGALLDDVCPHHYGCADLAAMQADFDSIRELLRAHAPGRAIKVAVTEWNTTAGDWGLGRASLWTLRNALACARYHNLMHRNCDLVEIANRSNLTNSFCSGILQTDNHRLYVTPTFHAQQLYATMAGTRALKLDPPHRAGDPLDASATLSADGRTLALFVVNDTLHDAKRTLDLSALAGSDAPLSIATLADLDRAGEPDVTNEFERADRIVPVGSEAKLAGGRVELDLPALSLTVVRAPVDASAR